jgi:hypothetical protein
VEDPALGRGFSIGSVHSFGGVRTWRGSSSPPSDDNHDDNHDNHEANHDNHDDDNHDDDNHDDDNHHRDHDDHKANNDDDDAPTTASR